MILVGSFSQGEKMWKISTTYGENLSATKLIGMSNDSLHTFMLGTRKSFAIMEIDRITRFNRNVNLMMVLGASFGAAGGLTIDHYINGNGKLDIKNNGVVYTLIGIGTGTFLGHFIASNDTIILSDMNIDQKKEVIEKLVNSGNT